MSRRSLHWWMALGVVSLTVPAHAQSVGSFDDPGASTGSTFSPPRQHENAPAPSATPSQQPVYPTAPTPVAPAPAAVPGQPNYGAGYQQSATPGSTYVLSPPVLPYRDGLDPPQGYVLEVRRNRGLMLGGGLSFGAAYTIGLVYALTKSFDNGTGWLAVPLVGPWGAIKGRSFECKSDNNVSQEDVDDCVDGALEEVTTITFLAVTGIVQAVGATLFFVGVGDKTREWVRADLGDVEVEADAGPVGSGYGFTLWGRF